MASTNIIHVGQDTVNSEEKLAMCFSCAVRYLMKDSERIVIIESTNYEFTKCQICDNYIYDKIDI